MTFMSQLEGRTEHLVKRLGDGAIDIDHYRAVARRERGLAIRERRARFRAFLLRQWRRLASGAAKPSLEVRSAQVRSACGPGLGHSR